jgi:hypothetical protein
MSKVLQQSLKNKVCSPTRTERWAINRLVDAVLELQFCPIGPDGKYLPTADFAEKWAAYKKAANMYGSLVGFKLVCTLTKNNDAVARAHNLASYDEGITASSDETAAVCLNAA